MEFKGTPGPWIKQLRDSDIVVVIGKILGKRVIGTILKIGWISDDDCGNPKCCKVEEHANAQLIASAPDILEALQNLLHLHSCEQEGISSGMPTPEQWLNAVDKAEKAVNKALGEE